MIRFNRKILVGLIVFAVIIWSYNAVRLLSAFGVSKKQVSTTKKVSLKTPEPFLYKKNFDDPFFCKAFMGEMKKLAKSKDTKSKKGRKKSVVKLPNCKLTGIVYNDQKPMAMLNYKGKSIIIKKGDIIDSMRIDRIYQDSVSINYKGKRFYLKK